MLPSSSKALIRRDPEAFPSPPHLSVLSAHWLLPDASSAAPGKGGGAEGASQGGGTESSNARSSAVRRDPARPPLAIPPQEAQAFGSRNDSTR